MKKIILSLGAIASMTAPVAAVIACGGGNENKSAFDESKKHIDNGAASTRYATKFYRPFTFEELKKYGKDQPIMYRGIGYTAYSQGMSFLINFAKELGFKLDKASTTNDLSDEEKAVFKAVQDMPKLDTKNSNAGNTWIDSIGADGGISTDIFFSTGLDKSKVIENHLSGGKFNIKVSEGKKAKIEIPNFFNYINGNKPGQILLDLKMTYGDKTKNISLSSNEDFYQTFAKIVNVKKEKEMAELIYNVFINMQAALKVKFPDAMKDYTHPAIVRLLEWIRDASIIKPNTAFYNKVLEVFKKLNNGSHNMFAVELFTRGVKNIPPMYAPDGSAQMARPSKSVNPIVPYELTGMANASDINTIRNWFYGPGSKFPNLKGLPFSKWNYGNNTAYDNAAFDPNIFMAIPRIGNLYQVDTSLDKDWAKRNEPFDPELAKVLKNIKKDLAGNDLAATKNYADQWTRAQVYVKNNLRQGKELPLLGGLVDKKKYIDWEKKHAEWETKFNNEIKAWTSKNVTLWSTDENKVKVLEVIKANKNDFTGRKFNDINAIPEYIEDVIAKLEEVGSVDKLPIGDDVFDHPYKTYVIRILNELLDKDGVTLPVSPSKPNKDEEPILKYESVDVVPSTKTAKPKTTTETKPKTTTETKPKTTTETKPKPIEAKKENEKATDVSKEDE